MRQAPNVTFITLQPYNFQPAKRSAACLDLDLDLVLDLDHLEY